MHAKWILTVILLLPALTVVAEPNSKFQLKSLRGRVVWMSAALRQQYGIQEVPEAAERILALEESNGALHPLVEDVRGRAFRRDNRLRDIEVELLVRQYRGSPLVQIIQVFAVRADGKYEIDYWCEICSIAMFEQKDCECCQGPIELRKRKVMERPVAENR